MLYRSLQGSRIREKEVRCPLLSAPLHAFPVHGPYCLNMYYYYQSYYELELARTSAGIT